MSSPILPRAEQLRQLQAGLAALYPTVADAQRLAVDAGLALNALEFQGSPINFWHNVLTEAEKQQKTTRLLELARSEYPDNSALFDAQSLPLFGPAGGRIPSRRIGTKYLQRL